MEYISLSQRRATIDLEHPVTEKYDLGDPSIQRLEMVLYRMVYPGHYQVGSIKGLDLLISERKLQITTSHCHDTLR